MANYLFRGCLDFGAGFNHLSNYAVVDSLFDAHPVIPVRVFCHSFQRLTSFIGDQLIDARLHLDDLFCLNGDIGRIATGASRGLMHQKACIGQGEAILFPGGQENIG